VRCAAGFSPEIEHLQGIAVSRELPWFWSVIQGDRVFHVPAVADLPSETHLEKAHFLQQDILSLIVVPLVCSESITGSMGFDSVRSEKNWQKEIIALLRTSSETIARILDRERMQKQLQESRERMALAVEGSDIGLWDWRVQTGRIAINERWAGIVGYTLDELRPVDIETRRELCHPGDLETSDRLLEKHFSGETEDYRCEVRLKHKNGDWVWVPDQGKVSERDSSGEPVCMAGTHFDITERKRNEASREKLLQELQEAPSNSKT